MGDSTFDEDFYLGRYPGVAEAVRRGDFVSGLDHYMKFGFKEKRFTSKADASLHDLMMNFCSLGHNCEFGMAQRTFRAEPLDLLRWANTPPEVLVKLLRDRLARIGDLKEIDIFTAKDAYYIRNKAYQFHWHAWANIGQISPDALRDRESKRLPFLASKLIEDLTAGTRIFVVMKPGMSEELATEILDAMHLYGRSILMYATAGAPANVVRLSDYLFHATIPKFANQADIVSTVSSDDWLAVCRSASEISLQSRLA